MGSSGGKYRTFSSNRSKIEVIQRSPNHTRGRTPWAFSSSGRVSVACSNSAIRVSAQSCWPKRNGELAPIATWTAGDGLGGVPVVGEAVRRDLEVELEAGAGGLRRDRVGVRPQPLDAADVQLDVLAAGADDLLVEHPVALVGGEVVGHQVALGERGQDADQDDPGVGLGRPLVGAAEAAAQVLLVVGEAAALDQPGRRVELQVELAQLGLEDRVGDVGQDLGVAHGRLGGRSTRLSSISSPVIGRSASKPKSSSISAKTSRQRRTFCRYRTRSSRENAPCETSLPMCPPGARRNGTVPVRNAL